MKCETHSQPFLPGLQGIVGESAPHTRQRKRISALAEEVFPIALNAALAAENLSFTTYAAMLATKRNASEGKISIARLSTCVGSSYFAIRQQVLRTPWWQKDNNEGIANVSLTADAESKLARIARRIALHNVRNASNS